MVPERREPRILILSRYLSYPLQRAMRGCPTLRPVPVLLLRIAFGQVTFLLGLRHLSHSPTGLWLQARLPLAWAARLAPLGAASQPAGATDGPRQPQRSIPYAGYMAIAAIALAWRHSQPLA